jgi:thioredoxin 1
MIKTGLSAFAVLIIAFWVSLYSSQANSGFTYFISHTSQSQTSQRPLSFIQIEELIRNETPDTAIAIEIQRRGIDFNPSKEQIERLALRGAGPKTIEALKRRQKKEAEPPPIVSIAESDFTDTVLKSQIPTLVFFCADIRAACKETSPVVAEIAQIYKDRIKVVKVDTYINDNIPDKYNAGYSKSPVLILFSDGTEQGRIVGTASKQSITHLIEKPGDFKVETPQDKSKASLPTVLESDFKSEVLESKEPALVFFCIKSYTTCDVTLSSLAKVAKDYKGKIKALMVDVYVNPRLAKEYDAERFYNGPVVALFSAGKEQGRIVGSASSEAIIRLIENPSEFKKPSDVGSDNVINVLESDFDAEVLKSTIPTLVFFCTARLDACKLTAPAVAEIADTYKDKVKVVKIDVDVSNIIPRKYDAQSYYAPVLVLFNRGKERDRLYGTASKAGIARMIEKALGKK